MTIATAIGVPFLASARNGANLVIASQVSTMIGHLLAAGFGVKCHTDAHEFRDFFRQVEGFDPASPLDAAFATLPPEKFFCVQILDADRRVIAMCCGRVIDAPRYRGGLQAWLRRQRIFSDRSLPLWAPDIVIDGTAARMHGRLGYVGGGWVMPPRSARGDEPGHPGWRRRGLIGFCVQLVHAHLAGQLGCDHLIGFVRPHHRALALSREGYGFAHEVRATAPYFPGTGYGEELYFVHISRHEVVARFARGEGPQYHGPSLPMHEPEALVAKIG
jgi:hypothetical protein